MLFPRQRQSVTATNPTISIPSPHNPTASHTCTLLDLCGALRRDVPDLALLIGGGGVRHHRVEDIFCVQLLQGAATKALAEIKIVLGLHAARFAAFLVSLDLIDRRWREGDRRQIDEPDQHRLVDEVKGEAVTTEEGEQVASAAGLTEAIQPSQWDSDLRNT